MLFRSCAELLEVYTNIAKLEWFEQILPGNSIEQLGLDIIRRLITADIERYYQIAIQERENYGELPRPDNPMDLLFLKHLHSLTTIMPDHSHVTELLDETHSRTQDLTFLSGTCLMRTNETSDRLDNKTLSERSRTGQFQHGTSFPSGTFIRPY